MPRSKNRQVAEILNIIKNDRDLRTKFLELLVVTLRNDFVWKRELAEIIGREMFDRP